MKTKVKQTLAIILTLIFVLCTLSACGTTPENAIVGKWYNNDGKCLDIRSDGSYKLEDSYGTGTWKVLNDNKTIEFMDVYGDTKETKIGNDDNGNYITFSPHGNFYKKAEDANQEEKTPSIKLTKAGSFSNGVAWICYNDKAETEQLALINTKGEIIYKDQGSRFDLPLKADELNYIQDKDGNYKLITNGGKVVANSQDGKFDEILACGDGFALVYKYSGPKDSKHLYGVIDKNGEFILDYINFSAKRLADYKGCGMFSIELSDRTRWALLNCKTGNYIYIGTKYLASLPEYVNNLTYFTPGYYIFEEPTDSLLNAKQMSYCSVDTNFKTSPVNEFISSSNGILIAYKGGYGNPISIINPKTNGKYTLDYNTTQLISLDYVDNLGLLKIKASDNNTYFTLLDTQGKEQFEPIKYNQIVKFSNGKIIYQNDKKYTIIDAKGKVLAENLEYKTIFEFSEDIAVAITTYDEYCFINSKGEKILLNIHE